MVRKLRVRISEQAPQVFTGAGNVQGPVRPETNEEEFRRTGRSKPNEPVKPTSSPKAPTEKGVPLAAQQREGEGRKAFTRRIQEGGGAEAFKEPVSLTAEQIASKQEEIAGFTEGIGEEVAPSADLPTFRGSVQPQAGQVLGVAGALGGAALAATATGVGAPVGAALGVLAGLTAAYGIIGSSIKNDRKKLRADAFGVFGNVKDTNQALFNAANNPQIPREKIIEDYNQNLSNLREVERRLTYLSAGKTGDSLQRAQLDLFEVRTYLAGETKRQQDLALALSLPDPNKITPFIPTPKETTESESGLFG